MSCVVDQDRQRPGAFVNSSIIRHIERPMHGGNVDAAGSGEGLGTVAGRKVDFHTLQYRRNCDIGKGQTHNFCEVAKNATEADALPMARPSLPPQTDPWQQRGRFLELLDAKVKAGTSELEIAEALGLATVSSFRRSYRYDRSRLPKRQVMLKAAQLFEVPLREIYDPMPEPVELKDELTLAREMLIGAHGPWALVGKSDEQILSAYRGAIATSKAVLSL